MTRLAVPRHRARKDSSQAARMVRMIRTVCAREREKVQGAGQRRPDREGHDLL
jgi:hypothetical protein